MTNFTSFSREKLIKTLEILLDNAKHNEIIAGDIYNIIMHVLHSQSIIDMVMVINDDLLRNPSINKICWFGNKGHDGFIQKIKFNEHPKLLSISKKNKMSFGRLPESVSNFLFAEKKVKSSLIIPLGDKKNKYIVAIGSTDELYFHPEGDIFLLEHLQNIINFKLSSYE
jgi:uncharacterized protein YigA (DUF484 family)